MTHQFDELAKALAAGVSRREALRRISGGLAGALLASLGLGKSWGSGGSCSEKRLSFCTSAVSTSAARARAACRTPRCINTVNEGEARALAGCRKEFGCPVGQSCVNSTCSSVCPQGQSLCNGVCLDLGQDSANCGSCGNICPSDRSCSSGQCQCLSGKAECNGTCTDTASDGFNCGACGVSCFSTGKTCCSGSCVDRGSDNNNCGACGNVCPNGQTCRSGTCSVSCGSGYCPAITASGVPLLDCFTDDARGCASGGYCTYGVNGVVTGDRCAT